MTLSKKGYPAGDFNRFKIVYSEEDIKEFIEFEKLRRENQLRIHWNWLKNRPYKEVVKFLDAITNKRAGEELI